MSSIPSQRDTSASRGKQHVYGMPSLDTLHNSDSLTQQPASDPTPNQEVQQIEPLITISPSIQQHASDQQDAPSATQRSTAEEEPSPSSGEPVITQNPNSVNLDPNNIMNMMRAFFDSPQFKKACTRTPESNPITNINDLEENEPEEPNRNQIAFRRPEPRIDTHQALTSNPRNVQIGLRTPPSNHRDHEIEALKSQLLDMQSKVHMATSSAPDIYQVLNQTLNTPFTRRISDVYVPSSGKVKLPAFSGISDPSQHLTAFSIAMARYQLAPDEHDPGYCQMFVETLEGPALTWFSRLPARSIDSFKQLSTAFLTHYSIYIQQHASDADLWTTTQGANESLRSYLDKFRRIVSQVDVSEATALAALRHGLWYQSPFRDDLTINRPRSLEDALHRGTAFVTMEEEKRIFSKRYPQTTHQEPASAQKPPRQSQPHQGDQRPSNQRIPYNKPMTYSIDSAPRELNTWFRPGSTYDSSPREDGTPTTGKYCQYHKKTSHNTSDCRQLKNYFLSLLQDGKIEMPARPTKTRRSTHTGNDQEASPPLSLPPTSFPPLALPSPPMQQPESPEDTKPTLNPPVLGKRRADSEAAPPPPPQLRLERIDVIMGGLQGCEDSIRSIRLAEQRAAPPEARIQIPEFEVFTDKLSFCDSDASGLHFPHNDPLVVDLQIKDRLVSRVLVDTGSTVNLIFWSTLRRMGIPRADMKPAIRPLTSFSGHVENTIGTIKLVVTAGRIPHITRFVVIDKETPYNAIMGTPWIHDLRAVVSTYHQCMKFPTPYGIHTLRGNQQTARSCFILEHRLRHQANAARDAHP